MMFMDLHREKIYAHMNAQEIDIRYVEAEIETVCIKSVSLIIHFKSVWSNLGKSGAKF